MLRQALLVSICKTVLSTGQIPVVCHPQKKNAVPTINKTDDRIEIRRMDFNATPTRLVKSDVTWGDFVTLTYKCKVQ